MPLPTVNKIRVFLASPSDVTEERNIASKVVEDINKSLGQAQHFFVDLKKWETDTYTAKGEYPQDVINKEIADYELFVGIMWKKFGSPTPNASAATEEEYLNALRSYENGGSCKQLMFFFRTDGLKMEDDFAQIQKVKDFKSRIAKDDGMLYKEYSMPEFQEIFHSQLQRSILSILGNNTNHEEHSTTESSQLVLFSTNFQKYLKGCSIN